jgi:hypothetical protein
MALNVFSAGALQNDLSLSKSDLGVASTSNGTVWPIVSALFAPGDMAQDPWPIHVGSDNFLIFYSDASRNLINAVIAYNGGLSWSTNWTVPDNPGPFSSTEGALVCAAFEPESGTTVIAYHAYSASTAAVSVHVAGPVHNCLIQPFLQCINAPRAAVLPALLRRSAAPATCRLRPSAPETGG